MKHATEGFDYGITLSNDKHNKFGINLLFKFGKISVKAEFKQQMHSYLL